MTPLHRTIAAAIALAVMSAIVWASNASVVVHDSERGVLRLAWSARPERVEVCREQSAEELASVPEHMRRAVVCEGTSAGYRLTVRHDGNLLVDRTLHGGGWRQDRRLYVFEELPLEGGEASIEVRLDRIESVEPPSNRAATDPPPGAAIRPNAPLAAETVPPHLSLALRVYVNPRHVLLVTYSPEGRALIAVVRSGGG
jgi:hypothetical protein